MKLNIEWIKNICDIQHSGSPPWFGGRVGSRWDAIGADLVPAAGQMFANLCQFWQLFENCKINPYLLISNHITHRLPTPVTFLTILSWLWFSQVALVCVWWSCDVWLIESDLYLQHVVAYRSRSCGVASRRNWDLFFAKIRVAFVR